MKSPFALVLSVLIIFSQSPLLHAEDIESVASQDRIEFSFAEDPNDTTLAQDQVPLRRALALRGPGKSEALHSYAEPAAKSPLLRSFVWVSYSLAGVLGYQVATGVYENPTAGLWGLLLAPPVLYLCDLTTQIVHKCLDSYWSESNPIWGETVRDFRKHHEVPFNLNREDYVGNIAVAASFLWPAFGAAALVDVDPQWKAAMLLYLVGGLNATAFHLQAHKPKPHFIARMLQKMGLAISRKAHMKHHTVPFDTNYGLLNGWSNPLSTKMRLWHHLDMIWWKLAKKMPHNWIQDPRSIPQEVVDELKEALEDVPPDLWEYTKTYPARSPEGIRQLVERSRKLWQANFIAERRKIILEENSHDMAEAERLWKKEQRENPWLFGVHELPSLKDCQSDLKDPKS